MKIHTFQQSKTKVSVVRSVLFLHNGSYCKSILFWGQYFNTHNSGTTTFFPSFSQKIKKTVLLKHFGVLLSHHYQKRVLYSTLQKIQYRLTPWAQPRKRGAIAPQISSSSINIYHWQSGHDNPIELWLVDNQLCTLGIGSNYLWSNPLNHPKMLLAFWFNPLNYYW